MLSAMIASCGRRRLDRRHSDGDAVGFATAAPYRSTPIVRSSDAVDACDRPHYPPGCRAGRWLASAQVISVRDDLRVLEGYHSAQVDVRVRLNTNESPQPPPAAFRDAFAAELSRVDWHRYPDRSATELRDGDRRVPRRVAGSGVRRQRLERGAADGAAGLRRARPHGGDVRADVPDARPDRPGHRCDRRRGRARRRLHARPGRGRACRSPTHDPHVVFLTLAEQPDRAGRAGRTGARNCSS